MSAIDASALPSFPLFPNPLREDILALTSDSCDICRQSRGIRYTGPRYSTETDDLNICPWCIADGSAAARDITFNDATIYPYLDSTPQMSPEDRAMVTGRTPGFTTWQGNHWLMHCGRACIYLGEARSGDLQDRWAAATPSLFEDENRSQEEIDDIVASIGHGHCCAYIFQCQVCRVLRGYWDCD
jgi:uncharacterized protein